MGTFRSIDELIRTIDREKVLLCLPSDIPFSFVMTMPWK